MTLTNEQLEKAARAYCEALGANPDQPTCHGYGDAMTAAERAKDERIVHGAIPAVALYSPLWMLCRPKIEMGWAMQKALKEGLAE